LRKAHEYPGACDRTGSGKERRQGERFMMIEVTAHQRHPVLMSSALRLICLPRASGVRGGTGIIESPFPRTDTGSSARRRTFREHSHPGRATHHVDTRPSVSHATH
jgi:hypothetical protein